MKILFAGAKPETKSEPFSDPRVAVRKELNLMTTFFELQKVMKEPPEGEEDSNIVKDMKKFLKDLKKRRRRK